jgi:hypothetical protein
MTMREMTMRKWFERSLALLAAASFVALPACGGETLPEKVERKIRNAGDDIEDAADELK